MGIIKRNEKKLTIQEMDANLDYLNSNNILDVDYYYDNNNLVIRRPDEGEINLNIDSYNIEGRYNIDDDNTTIYKFSQYEEFEEPTKSIALKYKQNGNTLPVLFEYGKSFNININLGYWIDNIYNSVTIKSSQSTNFGWDSNKSLSIGTGFSGSVFSIVQSDGKILVGGGFTSYNGVTANRIIRLNSDGSQDNTFNIETGFNSIVNTIIIQDDEKILVGGGFTSYNGVTVNRIIRLNSDGSIDTSFVIGVGFGGVVYSITIQDDGKILVGGLFTSYNGVTANRIIRLNSDGSIDGTFNIGSGFNNIVNTIVVQSDGKILVGGQFITYNGVASIRIIRLNSDGSQDTSFFIGTGFNNYFNSIVLQSDGKILVGGVFTSYNGVTSNKIIRLNTDGSQDESFVIGTGFNKAVSTMAVQSDGKILICDYLINALPNNGSTSGNSRAPQGQQRYSRTVYIITEVEITSSGLSDGDVITSIGFNYSAKQDIPTTGNFIVYMQNTTDTTNTKSSTWSTAISGMTTVSNSSITIPAEIGQVNFPFSGGSTFTYTGGGVYVAFEYQNPTSAVATTPNVALCSTTLTGGLKSGQSTTLLPTTISLSNWRPETILGKEYSSTTILPNKIIRLNSDGSQDTSFDVGALNITGFSPIINSILVQPDGKILLGGEFTTYNDVLLNRIIRLNSDGSLDTQKNYQFNKMIKTFGTNNAYFELKNKDGELNIICETINELEKVALSYKLIMFNNIT